jgi:hypothetical protein
VTIMPRLSPEALEALEIMIDLDLHEPQCKAHVCEDGPDGQALLLKPALCSCIRKAVP